MSSEQRNRIFGEIFIGKVHASDGNNGRIFRCFIDDRASNACTIGSFFEELRRKNFCNLSESLAHIRLFSVDVDNVLFETIDFLLELLSWIFRLSGNAVCFSLAPLPLAASACTRAFPVIITLVWANHVVPLIPVAIILLTIDSCLRNGKDAGDGDCEFHVFVESLFFIC